MACPDKNSLRSGRLPVSCPAEFPWQRASREIPNVHGAFFLLRCSPSSSYLMWTAGQGTPRPTIPADRMVQVRPCSGRRTRWQQSLLYGPCNRRQNKPESIRSRHRMLMVMIDLPQYCSQATLPVRVSPPIKLLLCDEDCKQAPCRDRPSRAQQQVPSTASPAEQVVFCSSSRIAPMPAAGTESGMVAFHAGDRPASHAPLSLSCSHAVPPYGCTTLLFYTLQKER